MGAPFSIDADFAGGNILVDRVEGDTVHLSPDLRDTEGWWFYWNFKIAGVPAGKTVTFDFGKPNPIGVRGPAVSTDGGESWSWLGAEHCVESAFTYTFHDAASEVWFSFTVPYVESNLRAFLAAHETSAALKVERLCTSAGGREVELLRAGCLDGSPRHRVLLTARHHACESMANFVLEGILGVVLADDPDGAWFQRNVEVLAVPFMDKDGVEQGDQGKNRRPRDHNRDYVGESVHPEVAAMRALVPEWSGDVLRVALDLHCPYIRGQHNEHIYLVGSADAAIWKSQQAFGVLLEQVNDSPLPYHSADNLPHGVAWNTAANYDGGLSFGRWAESIPGIGLSGTFEIPYANVGGAPVTAESARAFGRSLARAIRKYLSRRYDFLSSLSRHSVSLDSRYRTDALSFLSRWTERNSGQPLGVDHPVTPSGNSMRRRQDLSSSRETSMFRLHLFQRPRTAQHSQTITGGRRCPHSVHDEDADIGAFEAQ